MVQQNNKLHENRTQQCKALKTTLRNEFYRKILWYIYNLRNKYIFHLIIKNSSNFGSNFLKALATISKLLINKALFLPLNRVHVDVSLNCINRKLYKKTLRLHCGRRPNRRKYKIKSVLWLAQKIKRYTESKSCKPSDSSGDSIAKI